MSQEDMPSCRSTESFAMSHIVTLTTDLGSEDYYAAILKGQLYSHIPDVQVVDITHDIETYDIVQGALFLGTAYPSFPRGTIHLALVHAYYKPGHRLIAFSKDGHHFVGPDNGLFSLIWADFDQTEVYAIDSTKLTDATLTRLLTHVASGLAHELPLAEMGAKVDDPSQRMSIQPVVTADQIRATIIHIDRFDNAIINLKKDTFDQLRAGRRIKLYYKHDDPLYKFSQDYTDVGVGEPLAMWNEAGYLEIAVNLGKASSLYNLNKNETIQIYFLDA
jgi:S-adenosylmethionine hydrolase